MIETKPSVYLIAHTTLTPEYEVWLKEIGGDTCLSHIDGQDSERLIELAARRCYLSFAPSLNPNVKKVRTSSEDYHRNILSSGHGSVLEHASATFAIEKVSRVFTHEIVRHRVGVAYSQESLRYVRLTELGFSIPDCIKQSDEAIELFRETVVYLEEQQYQLAHMFDIDNMNEFSGKKILTSAFRRIAPMGLSTGIVVTANFRALRWLIEHRTSPAAEAEMREVMGMVADICMKEWPMVFGDFTRSANGTYAPQYSKV